MPSSEFTEWMAYESLQPGEPERGDLQAAVIALTVANAMGGSKKQKLALKDFMLKFDVPTKRGSTLDLMNKMKSWAKANNAHDDVLKAKKKGKTK